MSKKVWSGLLGSLGFLLIAVVVASSFGCATTSSGGKVDPGILTTEAVVISGSASYSGGTVDLSLGALIVSGEAITVEASKFSIFVGKSGTATSEWKSVDFTVPGSDTKKPIDIAFILDNTGSMSGRIKAVKDSIAAFAASLEAGGVDATFGAVAFGDYSVSKEAMKGQVVEFDDIDLTNATSLGAWLNALPNWYGYDGPENPLDSVMSAYNNFTWRSGAQKVFVVITDVNCHQVASNEYGNANYPSDDLTGSPISDYNISLVVNALKGKGVVHVISYDYTSDYTKYGRPYGDTRQLADGLGRGLLTPEANTGGRWAELPSSGSIDLTSLGISEILTRSYAFRFSYTFEAGTWFIHILVDTDGDGVFDSDLVISVVVAAGASVPQTKVLGLTPLAAPEGTKN